LEEMDALVRERDEVANERDAALRERAEVERERDVAIREREDVLDEKDELLHQRDEARKQVAQMEVALEDAEMRILDDAEQIKSLQGKIASLERERTELIADRSARDQSDTEDRIPLHEHEALVSELERQLDDAHRDIARLTTESPAGTALAKAKDMRIEQLEKEKGVLAERIQVMRSAGFGAGGGAGTPGKVSFSGSTAQGTPLGRLAAMNLRTPRTPGVALRDVSSTFW
jgi:TolA-binding protein